MAKVRAGRALTHRLAEMGLVPGVEVRVLQDGGGPVLVAVMDTRLALGRGMAQKVLVTLHPLSAGGKNHE